MKYNVYLCEGPLAEFSDPCTMVVKLADLDINEMHQQIEVAMRSGLYAIVESCDWGEGHV